MSSTGAWEVHLCYASEERFWGSFQDIWREIQVLFCKYCGIAIVTESYFSGEYIADKELN